MKAEFSVFRCLSDNYGVLMHDPATGATATIDVPEADAVERALDKAGWKLTDILVTHRHGDHIGGIPAIRARHDVRLIAPAKARAALPDADLYVGEGDTVSIGSLSGLVFDTPGHCADHVSYHFVGADALFCGDVIFKLGCGRVSEAPMETLWHSIEKLMTLPDDTHIYCGHDYLLSNVRFARAVEPGNNRLAALEEEAQADAAAGRMASISTLAQEKELNPFLRAASPDIARAVNLEDASPAEIFAALREWKNRF